jgi:hypothetical protein
MDILLLNAHTTRQHPPTNAQKISKQNACYLLANLPICTFSPADGPE